jgi:excisionase family DNA binding protein
MNGWAKTKAAAQYAGVSPRTFEDWLKEGLVRFAKLPSGTRLIKYQWIDEALERFADDHNQTLERIVDETLREFSK